MTKNYLPGWGKTAWQNNKPFLVFAASLLILLSVLKIAFYQYNYSFVFGDGNPPRLLLIGGWSLITDLLTVLFLNLPFLLLLHLVRFLNNRIINTGIVSVWIVLNAFMLLLNLADIFYFRFHFQRADADLRHVLMHPWQQLTAQPAGTIAGILIAIIVCLLAAGWATRKFYRGFYAGKTALLSLIILLLVSLSGIIAGNKAVRWLHPAYPLSSLSTADLVVAQNSAHCFAYSLLRNGEEIKELHYFSAATCDSLVPVYKTAPVPAVTPGKRNVMLFIMESVPYDFFDSSSKYKVAMPFFDSLLKRSRLYTNAFCFAHQSNKGITAILAGLPTLIDIPLYHSSYLNLPVTRLGNALGQQQYHSFLCIGDDYDNFGFAKCSNWLGFDNYYCKQDIPGYKNLPMHPMGIQDEYVLDFVHQTLNQTNSPFLGVFYNVSTHYPYTLPPGFAQSVPANYTAPMKSMRYYGYSLGKFFAQAGKEGWFKNTVFIFCADHWLVPDEDNVQINAISSYRIPIIIYDPQQERPEKDNRLCSQFDILGTILSVAGNQKSFISYGDDLLSKPNPGKTIFTRANSSLYHAIDSNYVLGFNSNKSEPEFLYNYRQDPNLKQNLLGKADTKEIAQQLEMKMKAFLQQAAAQYLHHSKQ